MSTAAASVIDTSPIDRGAAVAIELAEARAWSDVYRAAPPGWASEVGLGTVELDGTLVLHWAATGRRYFSRAIGLGMSAPATPQGIEAVLEVWRERGIDMFLVQSMPQCAPGEYERWLSQAGLEPFDAQDRIVRGGQPVSAPSVAGSGDLEDAGDGVVSVHRVGPGHAEEWSGFVQRVYGLHTGAWLPRLIGRPGWHQYVARREGEIVAARGMYIGPDGTAWLGMNAPVPGVMTDDYESDAAVCERIVADGLSFGARAFIADIEAPSQLLDTPAYGEFARLGFRRPYTRTHWTVPSG